MKFAYAAVLASLGLASGKRVSRATQKKQQLLRKAVPVNKDGTRRQLGEEFEVTGYHTIVFDDCLSLTWQNEDALDENLVELTAAGTLTPQTSYAIFQIINKNNAYYQDGAAAELWMLPLADWIEATAMTEFEEKEDYCEACEQSYDVCYPEQDEDEQGEDENQDGDERKKRYLKRKLTAEVIAHRESMNAIMGKRRFLDDECREYVNCYTCESRGCFEEEEDDNDNNNYCDQDAYQYGCEFEDEAVQEFMQEAACVETGKVEYGQNGEEIELRAGLMCNDDGSGVEMAMFADDECSLYYSNKSFSSQMKGTYTYAILGEAAQNIMKPYINSIDCLACEYQELCDEDCDEEEEEANGEAPEASETCQQIMDEAVDVDTCAGAEQEYKENQYNDNQNDGQYIPDVWYTYDFTDGEEPDAEDICFYLQGLNGEWSGKHVFNSDEKTGGGNFFDYKAAKNGGGGSGGAGKTFGIIIAVIVVVVAGVLIMQNFNNKRDSKKVPLVGNNKATMA
jgi:hypothetical protein